MARGGVGSGGVWFRKAGRGGKGRAGRGRGRGNGAGVVGGGAARNALSARPAAVPAGDRAPISPPLSSIPSSPKSAASRASARGHAPQSRTRRSAPPSRRALPAAASSPRRRPHRGELAGAFLFRTRWRAWTCGRRRRGKKKKRGEAPGYLFVITKNGGP